MRNDHSLTLPIARWYFSHFPIDRGKWRLWVWFLLRQSHFKLEPVECRIIEGIRMRLNPADFVDRFIYFWNCWEPNETWAIRRLLKSGHCFVDVGANSGYFTLLASRIVGREGKVIAFEPVPPSVEKLEENLRLNNCENVEFHRSAVSDAHGTVRIHKHSDSGANSIRSSPSHKVAWDVPMVSLDEQLSEDERVDFVKIDVEGAELRVLKGFQKHLGGENAPVVLCEITDAFLRELGDTPQELFSLMSSYGYRGYLCDRTRFAPASADLADRCAQFNVIFSKKALC